MSVHNNLFKHRSACAEDESSKKPFLSIIMWSLLGKQNIQAKEVYSAVVEKDVMVSNFEKKMYFWPANFAIRNRSIYVYVCIKSAGSPIKLDNLEYSVS